MNTSVLKNFDKEKVGFLRFKELQGKYLITSELGDYHFLTGQEFEKFLTGKIPEKSDLYKNLQSKNFIRNYLDFDRLVSRWRMRNQFLWKSTSLHIVVVTLRCDHNCVYCQANSMHPQDTRYDMTQKTARKVVERIFECPAKSITIEFQGGEPLLNFPAVCEIIKTARNLSAKTGKRVNFSLVTNLTHMDDEKLDFLLANKVNLCTSLDGPRKIHNFNRVYTKGDSYANAINWMKKITGKLKNNPNKIGAILTVTKSALEYPKEIVDEYFNLGKSGIFIRYVNPLGMAKGVWEKIGYPPEKYIKFYEKALDYILKINLEKRQFSELTAVVFLTKILSDADFSFMDMRSPCGASIGQIAYYYDGNVYTCDEARMMSEMGDVSFCIGNVYKNSFRDFITHPATRCLVTSSCTDVQTSCSWCVYKPYCGVCPVLNLLSENDLYGRMPQNLRCKVYKAILDIIFEKLQNPTYHKIFKKWVASALGGSCNVHKSYIMHESYPPQQ